MGTPPSKTVMTYEELDAYVAADWTSQTEFNFIDAAGRGPDQPWVQWLRYCSEHSLAGNADYSTWPPRWAQIADYLAVQHPEEFLKWWTLWALTK